MDYLGENFKINLALLNQQEYPAFRGIFKEQCDPILITAMLEDNTLILADDGVQYPRFTPEAKTAMKKILTQLKNNSINEVRYYQAKKVGRFYSNDKKSLTNIARNMRNTHYHYQGWVDYDFKASHPTLVTGTMSRYRKRTTRIDEWVANKEPILAELVAHHSVEGKTPLTKDHIKKLINSGLYGGGIVSWGNDVREGNPKKNELPAEVKNATLGREHPWYKEFKMETKAFQDAVWENNPELRKLVCDVSKQDFENKNTLTSYYLGILENECLYHAYNYMVEHNIIKARRVALAYDGFTAPQPCPYPTFDYLQGCNDYILEKTGFAMTLIIKEFEFVQMDMINVRTEIAVAEPLAPMALVVEGQELADDAEADEAGYDQEYLIWRDNFERSHIKIRNTGTFIKTIFKDEAMTEVDCYTTFTKQLLVIAYENEFYTKISESGAVKKKVFINEWLGDNAQRKADTCDLIPPPLPVPRNCFNMWRPSKFEGKDITATDEGWNARALELFKGHLAVIGNHEDTITEYLTHWFAHLIQKPAEKSTHLCIVGRQGAGKTTLFYPIAEIMAGKYFECSSPERDIWGQFNGALLTNTLICLSEIDKRNTFGADGKIKALITDKRVNINQKNREPFEINSYHRFVTTTNNPDPIQLEEGDRRNCIIKTSDEKKGDFAYFTEFLQETLSASGLLTIYSWLNSINLDNVELRNIPHSQYHHTIREHSRQPLDLFFEWWVQRQFLSTRDEPVEKMGAEMLAEFRSYKESQGGGIDVKNAGDLIKKLVISLNLPKGAIEKGQRRRAGQPNIYDIKMLRKHYNLGCLLNLPADDDDDYESETGAVEAESDVENEILHQEDEAEEGDEEVKATDDEVQVTINGKKVMLRKRK